MTSTARGLPGWSSETAVLYGNVNENENCDAPRGVARQRGGSCSSLWANPSKKKVKHQPRGVQGAPNPSKTHPKPSQDPSKIHPQSLLEPIKIDHWRLSTSKVPPIGVPDRFFSIFGPFLEALGPPKMEPKWLNIAKKQ